jgi:hypothetical protein
MILDRASLLVKDPLSLRQVRLSDGFVQTTQEEACPSMGRHKKSERKKELDRRRKRREKRLKARAKEAAGQQA